MIIVTGGAGFIGSAIISRLNERGISDIIVVDEENKLNVEKKRNFKFLKYKDFLDKDVFIEKFKRGALKSVEAVFHLGACSDTTEMNEEYLMETNYEYSKKVAVASVKNNIYFIYASSGATYGDGNFGFNDSHKKLHIYKPLNLYGQSKHLFDIWAQKNGLLKKITGLKYFNVYGPNEYHKSDMRSFVIKAYEQIKGTGKVCLFKSYKTEYKDGEQKRDFIYIKDAVDMTLYFYDNRHLTGIYNIGTGIVRSWNDLVKSVFRALEMNKNIEYIDMPLKLKNQYQYYTEADMKKFTKTAYKKKILTLEDGVADYVQNYLLPNRYLNGIKN